MVFLKIPIEAQPALRPRFGKGITYTPQAYRDYKNVLFLMLQERYKEEPLIGPLEVGIIFSLPKPKSSKRAFPDKRPDLDNYVKAFFDAANMILWDDDSQVVDLHAFKMYGPTCITVTVKPKEIEQ